MTHDEGSPYAVLEISRSADAKAIEAAYHRLHGLLSDGALASYGMLDATDVGRLRHQLDEAYAVLSCSKRRAAFDSSGTWSTAAPAAPQPGTATPPGASAASSASGTSGAGNTPAPGGRAAPAARAASAPAPAGAAAVPLHRPPVVGRPALRVPLLAELGDDAQFSGTLLRRLRESAEVSVDELSEWTKIGRRYLLALENDDYALLPAKVYVRGFVGEVARVLGLDVARVCRSYLAGYSAWAAEQR